jgi:hypothetical protein
MAVTIPESSQALFEALSLLQPYDIDKRKVRWGTGNDGGHVFAQGIRPEQPLLSLGMGWNCDLELQFAEEGHPVAMFDPTIEAHPHTHPSFTFHKFGVAGADSTDGQYRSFESVMALSGFGSRNDLILTMDVEGYEFEALANTPEQIIRQFEQIVIEIHWLAQLSDPNFRAVYMPAMKLLSENFTIFHVHANNCAPLRIIGGVKTVFEPIGGFVVADVLKLSLIRSDLAVASESHTFYPTSLDRPNHSLSPDHMLAFYPFVPASDLGRTNMKRAALLNDVRYRQAVGE